MVPKSKKDPALVPAVVPAIAFVRGGSVAILVKLTVKETEKSYYVLARQIRFPVGGKVLETCAGMTDGKGNVLGVVVDELREELGIDIKEKDIEDNGLGSFYPSPGGCDEEIHLFYYEGRISAKDLDGKKVSVYGVEEGNEHIMLHFVPERQMNRTLMEIGDAKAEIAYRRYQVVKKQNRCGYSDKTGRCGAKYQGKQPEYCETNDVTGRCYLSDKAPRKSKK